MLGLYSCVPVKKIPPGQKLLFDQSIEGAKKLDIEELEALYRQKPNRKILYMPIMPYLSLYFIGKKHYENHISEDSAKMVKKAELWMAKAESYEQRLDSIRSLPVDALDSKVYAKDTLRLLKKERKWKAKSEEVREELALKLKDGNWLMRSIGDPPSIYSQEQTEQTRDQMSKYLKSKGYFYGQVRVEIDTSKKRRVSLNYVVEEGKAHLIDSLIYQIPDTSIRALVQQFAVSSSKLKIGDRYDKGNLENERLNLLRLMKDNGYYEFAKSYILFEVDTTIAPYKASITTIIRNPAEGVKHKVYRITETVFDTDVDISRRRMEADTIQSDGIFYIQRRKKYSKKVLDRKVFMKPGQLYSQTAAENTQRALASLDIFKFVNIKYDTTGGAFKANIFTSPYPKYQITAEGGLNVGQAFIPGPFMSFSFSNRNMLNSADIFEIRAQFSTEAQSSVTDSDSNLRSLLGNINSSVTLPRIVFPIPRAWKRKLAARLPKTQISLGYSYTSRPEYTRTNLQGGIAYQWVNKKKHNFSFSLLDLGVVNTTSIDDAFQQRLDELEAQGNTLIFSFQPSIVSSTNFSFVKSSGQYGKRNSRASYLRIYVESGGSLIDVLRRLTLSKDQTFLTLPYYQFAKFSVDKRWSIPLGANGQLASRVHFGFAEAYNGTNEVLPYEKYFFTGGSSSNRAWRARRVGPGSYTPDLKDDGTFDDRFEQYGEMLIEANIEWRGNLFSFVDAALFVDATNIWMTQDDPNRPGAKFEIKDFWRELAIGSGVGLRFDFSFLLIRFDLGVKMYDPALPVGNRFIGDRISFRKPLGEKGQHIVNVGIGYPF